MQTDIFPNIKPQSIINLNVALKDIGPTRRRLFLIWHRKHPHVWKEVERRFIEKAKNGQMRIGIKEIFEELRQAIASEKREDDFKLNNNWTSVYARLLAYKYPELSKRLELRTVYA